MTTIAGILIEKKVNIELERVRRPRLEQPRPANRSLREFAELVRSVAILLCERAMRWNPLCENQKKLFTLHMLMKTKVENQYLPVKKMATEECVWQNRMDAHKIG